MRIGNIRALRTLLYAIALAAMVMAIVLPGVSAKDNPPFRVRVFVASVDTSGVDVWIDNVQLTNNAQYKSLTAYTSNQEGNYALKIYPAGKKSPTLVNTSFFFHAPKDYTIVVFGKQADNTINAQVEVDRNTLDGTNTAKVRVGNYVSGTAPITFAIAVSNTVLGTAKYGETGDDYTTVAAGTYTLIVNDSSNNNILKQDNIIFGPNTSVSVFLIGLNSGAPMPALFISTDAGTAPTQSVATPTTAPPPAPAPATPTTAASAALRQAFAPVSSVANTDTKVFYAATGHTLGTSFKAYWESHGGLAQFGYPISEEYPEVSLTDGKTYITQYFERARFEYHPENKGTPYEVLQGLLGREMLKLLGVG